MTTVDQSGASASGDIVARDKNTTINNYPAAHVRLTKVEQLQERLRQEVEGGCRTQELIDRLAYYAKKVAVDGVVGLEAKLEVSGRSHQLLIALEMKEQFVKLLERWSLYASAQQIFVHLLAKAELRFNLQVHPNVPLLDCTELDELVEKVIIDPFIEEVGVGIFSLDHQTAMGMIYWLAEQCRIRWHQ